MDFGLWTYKIAPMKPNSLALAGFILLAAAAAPAATRYVDANSANPAAPYNAWTNAARVIQDAIDASAPGDEVMVTNGVYATGGRALAAYPLMTNRVTVDRAITLRSINGPEVTMIKGYQLEDFVTGDGAIRCVYLTNGAVLSGFTLTNGATRASGFIYAEQTGGGVWCATNGVVTNCTLTGNATGMVYGRGGGAYQGTFNRCTFKGNSASNGGGAYGSTLNNCLLTANGVGQYGGGAYAGMLNDCRITGNSAEHGGGTWGSTLANCLVSSNSASVTGGGSRYGALSNCTLVGNVSAVGGGALLASLFNCILYYNDATNGANYYEDQYITLSNSCTTPLPTNGTGNITNEPAFVDLAGGNLRLQAGSPCINAGDNAYVTSSTDLDGRPRIAGAIVDMGAYEWRGPTRYVNAASTNPVAPYSSWLTAAAVIQDAVDAAVAGDEVIVTNGVYATGGRTFASYPLVTNRVCVDRAITLRSANGPEVTVIQGYQVPGTVLGKAAIRCAYLTNGAVLSGFTLTGGATADSGGTSWDRSGGGLWCEQTSALATNCIISGNSAAWAGGGSFHGSLNNCTLNRNSAGSIGGGAYSCKLIKCIISENSAWGGGAIDAGVLNNCIISSNSATYGGGGTSEGRMNNCLLIGNSAPTGGGGYASILINCTLIGNSASVKGGGAASGSLNNCIAYYNTAPSGSNYYEDQYISLANTCTAPMPSTGVGNFTNEPLFLDRLNGNLRLQSNSPCINAGNNDYVTNSTDLDGHPRIFGAGVDVYATVDLGAYEFQGVGAFVAWLQAYALPTDGTVHFTDDDHDGFNNYQEYRCGSNPTNALSFLCLLPPAPAGTNVTLSWPSGTGRSYVLECSTNLGATPPFLPLATHLPGQPGTTRFTITNAAAAPPRFYRVGAE